MTEKSLIPSSDIVGVEIKLNPHNDQGELYRYHKFACSAAPDVLRLRDIADFKSNPDHAMIQIWLAGADKPTTVGAAFLFDVDDHTVEFGGFFVSPLVRGMGYGQLLADAIMTKFNDDNHVAKYKDINVVAKVRYGNYGPIPILNRTGFKVQGIADHKVYWKYEPTSPHDTACRLYEKIQSTGAVIEDDLFHALCSVHGNVRVR